MWLYVSKHSWNGSPPGPKFDLLGTNIANLLSHFFHIKLLRWARAGVTIVKNAWASSLFGFFFAVSFNTFSSFLTMNGCILPFSSEKHCASLTYYPALHSPASYGELYILAKAHRLLHLRFFSANWLYLITLSVTWFHLSKSLCRKTSANCKPGNSYFRSITFSFILFLCHIKAFFPTPGSEW